MKKIISVTFALASFFYAVSIEEKKTNLTSFTNEHDIAAQQYIDKLNIDKQKKYGPFVNDTLLFPTVIQNHDGSVLGLTYSSSESLRQAIRERGVFCHEGCKSCFESSTSDKLTILNPTPVIKIGICKGRQSGMTFNLLNSIGIHVYKSQVPRSTNFLVNSDLHSNIQLIEVRSADISTILSNKLIDIAICYDNIIPKNVESKWIKLGKENGIHPVKVVVIKRKGEIVPQAPTIFSEYPDLTREWALQKMPNAKIIHVHGGAETFLVDRMCDLAVAVKDSGETLKMNNLEVCDDLYQADLYVYVSPYMIEKHPDIIRAIRNRLQD